jgi:hypothetical protein
LKARRASNTLIGLALLAAAITIVLPATALGKNIFKFVRPETRHLWIIFGIVIAYFVITESVKLVYFRFSNHNHRISA